MGSTILVSWPICRLRACCADCASPAGIGTMPVARIAIEPEALMGVSGKLSISGAEGLAASGEVEDADGAGFRFGEFAADEARAFSSGGSASRASGCRATLASVWFEPVAAGIVQW